MDSFIILIPLLPLATTILICLSQLIGLNSSKKSDIFTGNLTLISNGLILLCLIFVLVSGFILQTPGYYSAGVWLESEQFSITLNFITEGFRLYLATLIAVLLFLLSRFARQFMLADAGFQRLFIVLNVFSSAIYTLLLSANLVFTFIGWEIAGVAGYFLIAYAYENQNAVINANRVFITNRIGDISFIMAIALCYTWSGSNNWQDILQLTTDLTASELNFLTLCFSIAALTKAAQFPFSPWLSRALDGPSTISALIIGAILVHMGIFIIIELQAFFEKSVILMTALGVFGSLTVIYASLRGYTDTDTNSALSSAITRQLGLMFIECGLGLWQLAGWHLALHTVIRGYQILTPAMRLSQLRPTRRLPLPTALTRYRWAYVMSLQGFWLDPLADWSIVDPALRLSKDLGYFDEHIIDATLGAPAPAINALSSLAQLEEQKIGAQLDNETDDFTRGSGLAGKLAASSSLILHWIEERLVIQGMHQDSLSIGRQIGHIANKIEQLLIRPRYLSLFVFISLLAAF